MNHEINQVETLALIKVAKISLHKNIAVYNFELFTILRIH